jgi:hypothetical protein
MANMVLAPSQWFQPSSGDPVLVDLASVSVKQGHAALKLKGKFGEVEVSEPGAAHAPAMGGIQEHPGGPMYTMGGLSPGLPLSPDLDSITPAQFWASSPQYSPYMIPVVGAPVYHALTPTAPPAPADDGGYFPPVDAGYFLPVSPTAPSAAGSSGSSAGAGSAASLRTTTGVPSSSGHESGGERIRFRTTPGRENRAQLLTGWDRYTLPSSVYVDAVRYPSREYLPAMGASPKIALSESLVSGVEERIRRAQSQGDGEASQAGIDRLDQVSVAVISAQNEADCLLISYFRSAIPPAKCTLCAFSSCDDGVVHQASSLPTVQSTRPST